MVVQLKWTKTHSINSGITASLVLCLSWVLFSKYFNQRWNVTKKWWGCGWMLLCVLTEPSSQTRCSSHSVGLLTRLKQSLGINLMEDGMLLHERGQRCVHPEQSRHRVPRVHQELFKPWRGSDPVWYLHLAMGISRENIMANCSASTLSTTAEVPCAKGKYRPLSLHCRERSVGWSCVHAQRRKSSWWRAIFGDRKAKVIFGSSANPYSCGW